MNTLKEQFEKTIISKTREFNKYIMDSLVDNKSTVKAQRKALLISYTVCSETIGCNKKEFLDATGQTIYGNKNTLSTVDSILYNRYYSYAIKKIKDDRFRFET